MQIANLHTPAPTSRSKRCKQPMGCRRATAWMILLGTLGLPLAGVAAPPFGAAPPPAARSTAAPTPKPLGCLIEPDRVSDIGSQVVGLVERIGVERGDVVSAGQLLVTLRADAERANAAAAGTRAQFDADVFAAKASLDLAEQKVRRAKMLVSQNFVSDQAAEQALGEAEVARQKVNQVQGQQRVWVEEYRLAQAQLALRTLRSPFAGVVVERFVNPGERVEDRPLIRVAVVDPLRVELMVPTAQFGSITRGDRVIIHPELPGAGAMTATVRHVDRVLDAASNSFRVRLSLPNPQGKLPAGLRCKAELPLAAAPPAAGAASGAAASSAAAPKLSPALVRPAAATALNTKL